MSGRWRERLLRLWQGLGRTRLPHDLDAEFNAHLELATDDYVRRGHARSDARRLAAARFGSRLAAREEVHDQRGVPRLDAAWTDLRYAARSLRRTPGFTAAAVLVLAVGIGINVAVFTVANVTLFKGFAGVTDQDRLVYVTTGRDCCVSYQDLLDWRGEARSFEALAAVADLRVAFDAGTGAETATATEVTANAFAVVRVQPVLGRDFRPEDERPGAHRVAILSDRFWRARLGADPGVLGRVVRMNGLATEIVGVMPPGFAFPQQQDLWVPIAPRADRQPRHARGLWFAVGRLAPGVTAREARAELETIGARLAAAFPDTNTGIRPWVQTFRQLFVGPDAPVVYGSLWAAVMVLLTITCANIANLVLARSLGRTRETGIRLALGAGSGRVIRQQLFESALLAIGGGALGAIVGRQLLHLYAAVAVPPTQPWAAQLFDYSVDARTVLYVVAMSAVTALAVGVAPALRMRSLDVVVALRGAGRGAIGRPAGRPTSGVMVATQVLLAVVLLSGAGVLARSFLAVRGRDLGFDPGRVLTTLTMLPASRYPDAASQFQFYDRVAEHLRRVPRIEAVAFSDAGVVQRGGRSVFEAEGSPARSASERPEVRSLAVSPGYFDTLGAALWQGRDFDERDGSAGRMAAIVNRRFATVYWPDADPIGRRLRFHSGGAPGPWLTIVGVAPDLHHGDLARAEVDPAVYLPLRQRPARGAWVLARTAIPPDLLAADMRRVVQGADPEVPLWLGPYTLAEWLSGNYWRRGLNSGLLGAFAFAALGLVSLGLFAVVAHDVARRSQELAVRIALGATSRNVGWLVVRGGLAPAGAGLAAGIVVSLGTNHLLRAQLVGVSSWDPVTLSVTVGVLIVTVLGACVLPVWRAVRTDPLVALRLE